MRLEIEGFIVKPITKRKNQLATKRQRQRIDHLRELLHLKHTELLRETAERIGRPVRDWTALTRGEASDMIQRLSRRLYGGS